MWHDLLIAVIVYVLIILSFARVLRM